jgi:hypothetical protein
MEACKHWLCEYRIELKEYGAYSYAERVTPLLQHKIKKKLHTHISILFQNKPVWSDIKHLFWQMPTLLKYFTEQVRKLGNSAATVSALTESPLTFTLYKFA